MHFKRPQVFQLGGQMSGAVIPTDAQMVGLGAWNPGGGSLQGPHVPTSHLGESGGCGLEVERLRLPYWSPSRVAAARSPSERTRGVSRQLHGVPTLPAQLAELTLGVPAEQEEANHQQQQQ